MEQSKIIDMTETYHTSREPHEVPLPLISPLLASQPSEVAPEEVLCRPPREAWLLARVLSALLVKMGRTGPLAEPRRGPQVGKSGDPRSQNADSIYNFLLFHANIIQLSYTFGNFLYYFWD